MKQLYNAKMRSDGRSDAALIAEAIVIQMTYQYAPHAGEPVNVFSRDEITVSGPTDDGVDTQDAKKNLTNDNRPHQNPSR